MKLIYKTTNKGGTNLLYYYGFSSIRLSDIIDTINPNYSYSKLNTSWVDFDGTTSVAPIGNRITIFSENNFDVYEGKIPTGIEIVYEHVSSLNHIIGYIKRENKTIAGTYPFPPPRNNSGSGYSKYKEIDPEKQRNEKYAARNYKGNLKF